MIYTEILDSDKILLKNNTCAIKTKLIVKPDTEHTDEIILTEENSVKDWTYDDDRYVPEEGFIGQFVARTLSGNLQNISEDFNIEDRQIELQMGIVSLGGSENAILTEDNKQLATEDNVILTTGGTSENWYSLGTFYITKPEENNVSDNTKFEAFDKTILFNKDFNADYTDDYSPVSFNELCTTGVGMNALNLAKYVCRQVGVEFGSTTFTNSDFMITSNQFVSGDSCRDVMKAIAQLAYSYLYIEWDDKCYIPLIQNSVDNVSEVDTLTNDEYFTLKLQKNNYGPINKVVIGLSAVQGEQVEVADNDSIKTNGLTELDIFDNQITYTPELRNIASENASVLFGVGYTPLEVETIGHPWFKGYKNICVRDMSGNAQYLLPLNLQIKYTGHIRTIIASVSETKAQDTMGYNKTLYKDLKDVKIILDKQNATLTETIKTVKSLEDGYSSLEKEVKSITTDSYTRTEINEIISGTSPNGTVVSSVTTTAGTLDKNGLTIEQSEADTKTNINANGMIIYDATGGIDDSLLDVNKDGMIAKNVKVSTYLNIGKHSRIEDYTSPDYVEGTGVFWIGSD